MENDNEKIRLEIREILEKNRDAQKGFLKAAENAKDTALKEYFEKKSNDRKVFNEKLIKEILSEYPKMDIEGSIAGSIHRTWMDVKALFSADNDESMLEEAIRGDKAALEEYNDVIDYKNVPIGFRFLLSEQREMIETDIRNKSTLESIKDSSF